MPQPVQGYTHGSAPLIPARPVKTWRGDPTIPPPPPLPLAGPSQAFLPEVERGEVGENLWVVGGPAGPAEGADVPIPIPTYGERRDAVVDLDEDRPEELVRHSGVWSAPPSPSPSPEREQPPEAEPEVFEVPAEGITIVEASPDVSSFCRDGRRGAHDGCCCRHTSAGNP